METTVNKNQLVMRSIRFPFFLDNDVVKRVEKLPKAKNVTDAYRYFVQLGILAFDQHALNSEDPERAEKAAKHVDALFKQGDLIQAVRNLSASEKRALALAVEFAKGDSDV